jgi:gas vesicle protein
MKGAGKHFIKGLAAGAVLGAVAALITTMENKSEQAQAIQKAAAKIKDKVAKHAKEIGQLTRAAYGKIVDTTVAEFKGLKELSHDEVEELRDELKESWADVEKMMKKREKPAGGATAKKPAKKIAKQ